MLSIDILKNLALHIKDERLKQVVISVLENPFLTFTSVNPLIDIDKSPAAPRKHHFFTGGLLLHTYSVAMISLAITEVLSEVYGIRVDKDLVLSTAILHDIYKYYQYTPDEVNGGYRAREDWYLSHDYAIVAELSKRNAPDKLIRAISEVHGQAPFTTIEGFVVHLADGVDARVGEHLQNILLGKIKDYDTSCPPFKVIDYLVQKYNLKHVVSVAIGNPEDFKRAYVEMCNELSSERSMI